MKKRSFKERLSSFNKKLSGTVKVFSVIAAVFLILGLGTLGSVQSTGKSYVLPTQQSGDGKSPAIVLELSAPEGFTESNITINNVYLNVGTVYNEIGSTATVQLYRATSATSFVSSTSLVLANGYEEVAEGKEAKAEAKADYNWTKFNVPSGGWRLSTYNFYKIVAKDCNMLINEIVFVGVDNRLDASKQKPILVPATVHTESVIIDPETGDISNDAALKAASAVIDSQKIPSFAQSSFFRFGEEEQYFLRSISEMRTGAQYYKNSVYSGDRVYNALGTNFLALGTLIFGMSPFGLRFFPMLASFGILVLGFNLVRKLFGDKAGLGFAVLYALCGVSLSLGHFGTPLTIGLFFLLASLTCCYKFYQRGVRKQTVGAVMPIALSGIFGAAAICVNSAYLVPVLGVAALFVFGVLKHKKEIRSRLDVAIEAAEEEQAAPAPAESEEEPTAKRKVAAVYGEYRYNTIVAPAVFAAFLVFGLIALLMISVLPMYFTYAKLYSDPANPSLGAILWGAFKGGFVGVNALSSAPSAWSIWYTLFAGTGEMYAVTAAGLLPAIAAVLAGVTGIVFAVIRLVKLIKKQEMTKDDVALFTSIVILLAGIVISLITAAFAKGGLAFMLLAYLCAFALAAGAAESLEGGKAKAVKITGLVLLVICFALFAVFTFSIPLSSGLMTSLLG